jgi:copper chaperone CopZ
MIRKKFKVPSMHCTACVITLEGIEDELAGIKRITASHRQQQMEVEYDETQVTEGQIIAAAKGHGYDIASI